MRTYSTIFSDFLDDTRLFVRKNYALYVGNAFYSHSMYFLIYGGKKYFLSIRFLSCFFNFKFFYFIENNKKSTSTRSELTSHESQQSTMLTSKWLKHFKINVVVNILFFHGQYSLYLPYSRAYKIYFIYQIPDINLY